MKLVLIITIMFLGIATAQGQQQGQQGQTVLQFNGQTNSSGSVVGSDPLSTATSASSSAATSSSPASASTSSAASGSASTSGSAIGAAGATGAGSGNSQSPVLLPGEIPDTSTQTASTTAAAPGSSSAVCPPPVPSTDGGSVNLTEIAGGASLGGC
jgi:cytoskeletal protein RodZ